MRATAEEIVHQVAFERNIPILEIAGDPFDIAIGPLYLNDGIAPCLRCVRPKMQKLWWDVDETISELRKASLRAKPLRKADAWQSAPSLSAIAGLAVSEAMAVASGYTDPALVGRRFNMSLRTFDSHIDEFSKNPNCDWCAS